MKGNISCFCMMCRFHEQNMLFSYAENFDFDIVHDYYLEAVQEFLLYRVRME